MKKIAIAVLLLFAASLFGSALAAACTSQMGAAPIGTQVQAPSSCRASHACAAGSCFAPIHQIGCWIDHGSIAVAQRSQSVGALVKAPEPTIIPVLSISGSPHDAIARSRFSTVNAVGIAGYTEVYARTGRLLI